MIGTPIGGHDLALELNRMALRRTKSLLIERIASTLSNSPRHQRLNPISLFQAHHNPDSASSFWSCGAILPSIRDLPRWSYWSDVCESVNKAMGRPAQILTFKAAPDDVLTVQEWLGNSRLLAGTSASLYQDVTASRQYARKPSLRWLAIDRNVTTEQLDMWAHEELEVVDLSRCFLLPGFRVPTTPFENEILEDHTEQDQLGTLAASFNAMTNDLETLREHERQRAILERDIALGREAQQYLYPRRVPVLSQASVWGVTQPACNVSGDLYDSLSFTDSEVGLICADVSGKGTSAALMMANLQAVAHGR
jgi:hypothetical protein